VKYDPIIRAFSGSNLASSSHPVTAEDLRWDIPLTMSPTVRDEKKVFTVSVMPVSGGFIFDQLFPVIYGSYWFMGLFFSAVL
jgi:hypothetical protein